MLWCQGAQNIGLSDHKLKSAQKVHRMVTMHARPRRTDVMAIARQFVLSLKIDRKNTIVSVHV